MRWRGRRGSRNIEDRRGNPRVGRRAGLGGGMTIIALIAAVVFGFDPSVLLGLLGGVSAPVQQTQAPRSDQDAEVVEFLSVVLADTEQVWGDQFQRAGLQYNPPTLVLYTDATPTACGTGQASAGPFYCPGDRKLYLDLSFLSELQRMGAQGDFAIAYVIAHEVGHHIQTLEGTAARVQRARQQLSQVDGNRVQVAMELQADCYAGVWAHHAHAERQLLESGDIEEGMAAASAVGDDTLLRNAGRRVVPEAFTHGSSAQRRDWLMRGLRSGRVQDCDTFS